MRHLSLRSGRARCLRAAGTCVRRRVRRHAGLTPAFLTSDFGSRVSARGRASRGAGSAPAAAQAQPCGRAGSALRQAAARGDRANARWRRSRGFAVRPAPGRARQSRPRVVGVQRTLARADAAVLARRFLGCLAHRPPHQKEQCDDRDFQDHDQPDEGPSVHSRAIVYPAAHPYNPPMRHPYEPAAQQVPGHPAGSPLELEGGAAELGDRVQLPGARHYLLVGEALDALGPELLDVE